MSAAPATANVVKPPTQGYAQIPNSIIENIARFTPAEYFLLTIILRKGGGSGEVKVSTQNWLDWTGMTLRAKEYAAAGLEKKCLSIGRRGTDAFYRLDKQKWEKLVIQQEYEDTRTAGRSVDLKPGAKVHPRCREHGCVLLAQAEPTESALSLVPAIQSAKPVAPQGVSSAGKGNNKSSPRQTKLSPVDGAAMAQRVSHDFQKSLAAMRQIYPLVGESFFAELVQITQAAFPGVNDSDMAEAVMAAWKANNRRQIGPGLFRKTIPEALAAMKNKPPAGAPSPALADRTAPHLARIVDTLRARGAPFKGLADKFRVIQEQLNPDSDIEWLEQEMLKLAPEIVQVARAFLDGPQRSSVAASVEAALKNYRGMTAKQLADLRSKITERETLTVLGIPWPSLFYA